MCNDLCTESDTTPWICSFISPYFWPKISSFLGELLSLLLSCVNIFQARNSGGLVRLRVAYSSGRGLLGSG